MARIVVAESAQADLNALLLTHSLPASTRNRVRISLRPLATFPLLGPTLTGRWQGFRFILGPWPWMLLVYVYDGAADQVSVVTIQDSRSARAATSTVKRRMRWTNDELFEALGTYEQACIDAGMRPLAVHSYWDYARRFLRWRIGEYRPRGATGSARRPAVGPVTTAGLAGDARTYADDVAAAGRQQATIDTYLRHAMFFVRWLDDDFDPGGRLTGR